MARIETPRFVLRPLTEADATDRYLSWLRDEASQRYILTAPQHQTLDNIRSYIREKSAKDDALFLGVFTKEGSVHIGNIKYEPIHRAEKYAVMGILIGDPAWRGKGVAAEVIEHSARWLKDQFGLTEILLGVHKANEPAVAAYKKAGFREDATGRVKSDSAVGLVMSLSL